MRSSLGDALSFHRSNGGHIYANQAAIVRWASGNTVLILLFLMEGINIILLNSVHVRGKSKIF